MTSTNITFSWSTLIRSLKHLLTFVINILTTLRSLGNLIVWPLYGWYCTGLFFYYRDICRYLHQTESSLLWRTQESPFLENVIMRKWVSRKCTASPHWCESNQAGYLTHNLCFPAFLLRKIGEESSTKTAIHLYAPFFMFSFLCLYCICCI